MLSLGKFLGKLKRVLLSRLYPTAIFLLVAVVAAASPFNAFRIYLWPLHARNSTPPTVTPPSPSPSPAAAAAAVAVRCNRFAPLADCLMFGNVKCQAISAASEKKFIGIPLGHVSHFHRRQTERYVRPVVARFALQTVLWMSLGLWSFATWAWQQLLPYVSRTFYLFICKVSFHLASPLRLCLATSIWATSILSADFVSVQPFSSKWWP